MLQFMLSPVLHDQDKFYQNIYTNKMRFESRQKRVLINSAVRYKHVSSCVEVKVIKYFKDDKNINKI